MVVSKSSFLEKILKGYDVLSAYFRSLKCNDMSIKLKVVHKKLILPGGLCLEKWWNEKLGPFFARGKQLCFENNVNIF